MKKQFLSKLLLKIIKVKKMYIELLILLVVGIITLNWFKGEFFLISVDSFFGLNPQYELYVNQFMWKNQVGTGQVWVDFNTLPHSALWALLERLGFSLIDAQKIVIYLLFTSSMLSMYILSRIVFSGKNTESCMARIFASLFYTMNPFTLSYVWWRQLGIEYFWVLFPAILAIYIKAISTQNKKDVLYLIFAGSIVLIVLSPGLSHIFLFVTVIANVFFTLFVSFTRKELSTTLKRAVLVWTVWFFSISWWLFPSIMSFKSYVAGVTIASSEETLKFVSQYSSILNIFRLLGKHEIYLYYENDPYYSWSQLYLHNIFFIMLGFMIPLIAYSSLLMLSGDSNKNRIILFFALLSVITIFVMKGASPPLPEVNLALLRLPFAAIFRHPYDKFAVFLCVSYSIMIASVLEFLLKRNRMHIIRKVIAITLVVFLIGVYGYPFFNGDVIYGGGEFIPSTRVKIPSYYYEISKVISDPAETYKIMALPITSGESAYKWNYGVQPNSNPLLQYFFPGKSIVQFNYSNAYDSIVASTFYSPSLFRGGFGELMGLWNIKYIVVHDDWNTEYMERYPTPNAYKIALNSLIDRHYPERALLFNGSGYIEVLNSPSLSITNAITLEALVKPSTVNCETRIIDMFTYRLSWQPEKYFGMYLYGVNGGWVFSQPLESDQWYHVVGTYDGKTAKLYINAVLVANVTATGEMPQSLFNLRIGDSIIPTIGTSKFLGSLGMIRIYSRALTSEEVLQNFLNNDHPSMEGLKLWCDFDQVNEGKVILDKSEMNNSVIVQGLLTSIPLRREDFGSNLFPPQSIGKLVLYRTKQYLKVIYASTKMYIISSMFNASYLAEFLQRNKVNISDNPVFVFANDQKSTPLIITPSSYYPPKISFECVNPTFYKVQVYNATAPFVLVFSETFDDGWKAFISERNQIPDRYHFVANGFANAWYVNQTENFTITLEYVPQRLFNVSLLISILTLASLLMYIISSLVKLNNAKIVTRKKEKPND